MAHPPLLPIGVGKGLGTSEKKDTPAVEGLIGLFAGLIFLEELKNGGFILIEVTQPVLGGFPVVRARPAPAAFQFQFSTDAQEEFVRGHGSPAKKVLGHPIIFALDHKGVGGGAVAKYMGE